MNSYTDKRACRRRNHAAVITFSYFNKNHFYEAQTLNHCPGGLRFKSDVLIQPGASIYIRVTKFHLKGACKGDHRGLRSVTLADVKWCKECLNETKPHYEIGAKYY